MSMLFTSYCVGSHLSLNMLFLAFLANSAGAVLSGCVDSHILIEMVHQCHASVSPPNAPSLSRKQLGKAVKSFIKELFLQ